MGFYSQKSPKIAHNLPANGSRYRLDRLLSKPFRNEWLFLFQYYSLLSCNMYSCGDFPTTSLKLGVDNSISSNSKIALQLARRVSILLE